MGPTQTIQATLNVPDKLSCNTGNKTPLILSASRRTDLPGFYPEECANIIRNKISRFRTRYLYGVMFWSKAPLPFITCRNLRSLVDAIQNPMLQLTITGLGGTHFEPGIPKPPAVLNALPEIISIFKSTPQRIRWRFDPLLKNCNGLDHFCAIGDKMALLGIEECTISFPSYFSLKGNLTEQFQRAGIPAWKKDEQRQFLYKLKRAAADRNITLKACAQPLISELCPEVTPATCVDGQLFAALHPENRRLDLSKDRSQRKYCRCVESEDIGSYTSHLCHGRCVYCYSKAGEADNLS